MRVGTLGRNLHNIFHKFSERCCLRRTHKMSLFSEDSTESSESSDHTDNVKRIREFIPKLLPNLHKGQCGRIGVVGGSPDYTGAPYFAAMASLRLGADLVHVFCCRESGPVIKSYSPELMVHPFLDCSDAVKQMARWLEKIDVLVIGPGLGRNPGTLKNVSDIINHCRKNVQPSPPLVIDADGLHLVTEDPNIIKDYGGPLILTPNSAEYAKLTAKMSETNSQKLAIQFKAVLLQKGVTDIITNGIFGKGLVEDLTIQCTTPGSYRRCGGQGDILSGCIGTFVAWLQIHFQDNGPVDFFKKRSDSKRIIQFKETYVQYTLAVYGGCVITRTSSKLAFEAHGRGMTATDMISQIHKAYKIHFGQYLGN